MERNVLIIVALLLVVLTACAETPERGGIGIDRVRMPEWASTGRHPDYPDSEYITSFGLARTNAQARDAAEARLEELICLYVMQEHEPILKDTQFADVVKGPAAWFRLEEFGEAIVKDDVTDGFESVSMRGISRNELKLRAKSLLIDANEVLSETEMPPGGIGTIEKRMEMWGEYYMKAVRVVALELLAENTLNRTVFEKLEEAVLALWELPSLMKVSQHGGNQVVQIRGGAPKPLTMWASYRGKPVAGIPVRWGPAPGFAGTVEGDLEFDEYGGAKARVHYLRPNGSEWGYVAASLDLDAFIGRKTGVTMTLWMWQLMLPSINNGELVLDIVEQLDGETDGVDPLLADEIEKWAKQRGLAVAYGEPSSDEYAYRIKLSGKLDVVSSNENDVPVAFATGSLKLTNLGNSEELFSHVIGVRKVGQAGNTPAALMLVAQREGAADAMIEIVPRIVAALPGKSDLLSNRK